MRDNRFHMCESKSGEITGLLRRVSDGDSVAEEALIAAVYTDLRRLAAASLRNERTGHTLQPTALVHETYVRLVGQVNIDFQDRWHFFRVAAKMMRRILVDYARARHAEKRGGPTAKLPLLDTMAIGPAQQELVLELDEALGRLDSLDHRQAQVVEMRFFGGLSESEIALALGISSRTVKRDWMMAKAWLHGELRGIA